MAKKPLKIDCIAGSAVRDIQGEMLSVEGADISELENGNGRWNDNHGAGFFNSLGYITEVKKIFKKEDCENSRHEYYWEKVKAPFIYCAGYLYDDDDHPNARAAAAIIRNVHKHDIPLKMKASVEGGVIARGDKDPNHLARTKIHSVALTFTPANQATLVEPVDLEKNMDTWEADQVLIKSVMHLAKTDVPSFRAITRNAQAEKIVRNFEKINELAKANGLTPIPEQSVEQWIEEAITSKVHNNVMKIHEMVKALTAGYGGGSPTSATGGQVLQTESLNTGRGFKYFTCRSCGQEQVYSTHQTKCRDCGKSLPFDQLDDNMDSE